MVLEKSGLTVVLEHRAQGEPELLRREVGTDLHGLYP